MLGSITVAPVFVAGMHHRVAAVHVMLFYKNTRRLHDLKPKLQLMYTRNIIGVQGMITLPEAVAKSHKMLEIISNSISPAIFSYSGT